MNIPVSVIGGYLGAGKTTLLNRLLADPQGVRLAVVVNDFGSVNIDAALIANREGETISLTNGCVCCSIGDNLALALHDLAERPNGPEHIVIEASGVADPARIADYAASHPRLFLDGIIVVADAETVRTRVHDKYVGDLVRSQLETADLVVLSKVDLIDAAAFRQVRAWIAAEMPGARIVAAPRAGQVADLLLSGATGYAALSRPRADGEHARQFATWSFVHRQMLDGDALRTAVAALPPAVVRAKGIVRLVEAPERRFVLQLVGRRWSLEPEPVGTQDALASDPSVIVCIGLADQLEPEGLDALFASTPVAALPGAVRDLLQGEATT
ncbi:MAG: GTP-binding protein [Alphaproteobacteria bacterium]|nr:GTP-binding protein [Alphaproteobacteria bacterium]